MDNLFLTVLSISLTTSVVIVAVIMLGTLINRRYMARWKYMLWIVLALRLLIPFNCKLTDSPFQIQIPAEVGNMEVSDVLGLESPILEENEEQFTGPQTAEDPYTKPETSEALNTKPEIQDSESVKPDIPQESKFSITLLQALSYLWATGTVCLLLWQLTGFYFYKRRILKRGKIVENPILLAQLRDLSQELGIRKNITFLIYDKADSPMVIGFWHPVLVLPKEEYTQEESFYILRHELIHLRRHDVYVKFLLLLARDFHWFNPVIYLMHREAVVDMELACDEAVVRGRSYDQREAYTETLMSTLSSKQHKGPSLSTQFSGGKRVMKKRFKNILTKVNKKNGVILFAVILILTVTMGALTSLVVEATTTDGAENESNSFEDDNNGAENNAFEDENSVPENANNLSEEESATAGVVSPIYSFQPEDIAVEPEVQEYSFEDAVQIGEVWEIYGMFPGMWWGTWYIVNINGVEYYYGKYDDLDPEHYAYGKYDLYGWSIVDDSYELANGIKVGMNESELLEQFPNMTVVEGFSENYVYNDVLGFWSEGWNGTAYPRSYVGMDSDWNYEGKDYHWTDQFDYVIVADIARTSDTLPIYLGLLIKDHVVAAITFYHPTAG